MERKAWHCPACNAYHAPHCDTCPTQVTAPYYVPRTPIGPIIPAWPMAPLPVVVDPLAPPYITTYVVPDVQCRTVGGAVDISMLPH